MANYSYASYTGTGVQTDFTIPFLYIDPADVVVTVGGVSTPFTYITASAVRCTTAPASGTAVQVRRNSNRAAAPVAFSDGAVLLQKDLNTLSTYTLYVAQEQSDATAEAVAAYGSVPAVLALINTANANVATGVSSATASANSATASAASATSSATSATNAAASAGPAAASATASANAASNSASSASANAGLAYNYAQLALISDYGLLTGVPVVTDYGIV